MTAHLAATSPLSPLTSNRPCGEVNGSAVTGRVGGAGAKPGAAASPL